MTSTTNVKNQPPFRLIILGAGFSQPAGLPLGNDLLSLTRERMRPSSMALEEEIEQWLKIYPNEDLSLERVLGYSHRKHYLDLKGPKEWYSHGSRAVVHVRRLVQEILTETMPTEIPDVYLQFANQLTANDTIMTFNYDTLLENVLDSIGKPYSLTPTWWLSGPLTEKERQCVNIMKVHGSVDWYDRKPYDDYMSEHGHSYAQGILPDIDPIFGPNPQVKTVQLSQRRTDNGLGERIIPRVVRVPDYKKLLYMEDPLMALNVVPFMLPIAHDKILGHDLVLDFWWSMQSIVEHETSSITTIGYSMPKHDEYAYEAISTILMAYQEIFDTKAAGVFEYTRKPIQIINKAESAQKVMANLPFIEPRKSRVWHEGFSSQSLDWAFK